jgi:hypothetical protein
MSDYNRFTWSPAPDGGQADVALNNAAPGAPAGWVPESAMPDATLKRRPIPLSRPTAVTTASRSLVGVFLPLGALYAVALVLLATFPPSDVSSLDVYVTKQVAAILLTVCLMQVLLGWRLRRGSAVAAFFALLLNIAVGTATAATWFIGGYSGLRAIAFQAFIFSVTLNVVICLLSPNAWRWLLRGIK